MVAAFVILVVACMFLASIAFFAAAETGRLIEELKGANNTAENRRLNIKDLQALLDKQCAENRDLGNRNAELRRILNKRDNEVFNLVSDNERLAARNKTLEAACELTLGAACELIEAGCKNIITSIEQSMGEGTEHAS